MDADCVPEPFCLCDLEVGKEFQIRDVHGHVIYTGTVLSLTTGDDPFVTFRDIDGQKKTKGAAEMGLVPYPDNHWCMQRRTYPCSGLPPERFAQPEDCIPTLAVAV